MNRVHKKEEHHSYRWLENAHIFLWLIKDTCWAMVWRPGGVIMILPTVSVAVYLTWKSRHWKAELYHNIAVCCWILANSVWMVGEFYNKETRPYAVGIFVTGLLMLLVYYIFHFRKDRQLEKSQ
jgi:hypothetical protein